MFEVFTDLATWLVVDVFGISKATKLLGTGCAKCAKPLKLLKIANELNVNFQVIKETDPEIMMGYGVMSTSAVIIDEVNVDSG